jgi:hypothetical protein
VQLHQPEPHAALRAAGATVLALSFAPLDRLVAWVPYFRDTFLAPALDGVAAAAAAAASGPLAHTRFLADPDLAVYHAYGMGRNSALRVYGPRILWQYLRWAALRVPIRRPAEDPLQKGGDFVVGAGHRVTLAHVGRDQADRPPLAALLAACRR